MIERLETKTIYPNPMLLLDGKEIPPDNLGLMFKINELVDAINAMQPPGRGPDTEGSKQQVDGSEKTADRSETLKAFTPFHLMHAALEQKHADGYRKGVEDTLALVQEGYLSPYIREKLLDN